MHHHTLHQLAALLLLTAVAAACTDRNYSSAVTEEGDTGSPDASTRDTSSPDALTDTEAPHTTAPPDTTSPPPDAPGPTCGVDREEAVGTDALLSNPQAWLDQRVTLKGTLTPTFANICDDLGPCGTCDAQLTLDSALWLMGPNASSEVCGASLRCFEAMDSCWPEWSCGELSPGSMAIVRGRLRAVGVGPSEDSLEGVLSAYRFEVEALEQVLAFDDELIEVEGLFRGQVMGDSRCPDAQREPRELTMLVSVSPFPDGVRVEFMSPVGQQLPFDGTTHFGDTLPGSGCVQTNGPGGGELLLCLFADDLTSFNGTYTSPDSMCTLQLTGERRY